MAELAFTRRTSGTPVTATAARIQQLVVYPSEKKLLVVLEYGDKTGPTFTRNPDYPTKTVTLTGVELPASVEALLRAVLQQIVLLNKEAGTVS
jgi:hypothetical protein